MKFSLLKTYPLLFLIAFSMGCAPMKHPESHLDTTCKDWDPRFDPKSKDNLMPESMYPSQSRRLREQGWVALNVLVLSDGSIGDLHILKSSGFQRLDEAALDWFGHHGKYLPAVKDCKAIDAWKVVSVDFSLQ